MEYFYLITSIFGTILFFIFYYLITWSDNYWKNRGVKCIKCTPILGNMIDLLLSKKGFTEIYNEMYNNHKGEKYVGCFQFTTPTLLIRDPELINQILVKDFSHFQDRTPHLHNSSDLFSKAFINNSCDEWKEVRSKITPIFSTGKLKNMIGILDTSCNDLVDYLKDQTDRVFNIRDLMHRVIINANSNFFFGLKMDTFNEKDKRITNIIDNGSLLYKPSFLNLIKYLILWSSPIIGKIFRFKLVRKDVAKFFQGMAKDVINDRYESDSTRNDFIQLMLEQKRKEMKDKTESKTGKFTDDFISAQGMLFISMGGETVATVLESMLFEMAMHQDLQKKVQDEISKTLDSSNELNYESLSKLTYMDKFMYETLRLHPISPILIRTCTRDYKLPGTEVIIKKGNFIRVSAKGLHMDSQYFHDPEKFDPDRFDDMDTIPKFVYYPFGGGPRMCIAMKYGILQVKTLLAILLSNYSVSLNKKTEIPLRPSRAILVHADGGVWINFHRRDVSN